MVAAQSHLFRTNATSSLRMASNRSEVLSALGLVYEAYLDSGLILPNRHRARVTPFHLLQTTEVLIAQSRGEITSTLTLVRDGELGLPMENVFEQDVAARRQSGIVCAEVSCLAARGSDQDKSFSLVSTLMKFVIQCASHRGVDELLITVHPRHARFYERFLGFDLINDEEQSYDSVCGSPAVALSLDLNRMRMSATRQHKRLFGELFPRHAFRRRPLTTKFRAELQEIVDETYYSPWAGDFELTSEYSATEAMPLQAVA